MNRILCSTGALIGRPNGRDFTLLGECVKALSCDGYEFMMYDAWHERLDELKSFISKRILPDSVFHVEKDVGNLISRNREGDTEEAVRRFEINCSLAREFGANKLVLHLWGSTDSDKNIAHNMECYRYLREISDASGLSLMVENVVCNQKDPMTHLISLAKLYPDIQFTFDTKMAEFHRQMDQLYREENRWLFPYIKHIHLNDYGGGYMDWSNLRTLHIGEGHVDFKAFFAFARSQNYQGDFTVEATSFDRNGAINLASLNRSFDRIRNYLNDGGRK